LLRRKPSGSWKVAKLCCYKGSGKERRRPLLEEPVGNRMLFDLEGNKVNLLELGLGVHIVKTDDLGRRADKGQIDKTGFLGNAGRGWWRGIQKKNWAGRRVFRG